MTAGPVPLVSIAMATLDGAAYLPAQLESIGRQTWPRLEVVVSDDASCDATPDVLEAFREQFPLRVFLHRERVGVVRNFARAIAECRGDFISLSDQDDVWQPEKVERLMGALGDSGLAYCRSGRLTPAGVREGDSGYRRLRRFLARRGSGRPVEYLLAGSWIRNHAVLFRATLRERLLPVPGAVAWFEDWLSLVAATTGGVRYLDEELQVHREHHESFTGRGRAERPTGSARWWRVLSGAARSAWRDRCRREQLRLDVIENRLALSAREKEAVGRLRTCFGAGTAGVNRWRAFVAAARSLPFAVNELGAGRRLRYLLTPLLLS